MDAPDLAKEWEAVDGKFPNRLLDRYPDGCFVALQISSTPLDRAGVWDATSGRLIWMPEHAIALSWLPGGDQIVLIREEYSRKPDHPRQISSTLQTEYTYYLERFTWPQRNAVSSCQLHIQSGWPDRLVLSPRGDLAAVRWIEQDSAGFFLVALDVVAGDRQIPNSGYQTSPNLTMGPVFSPVGTYLVLSCSRSFWWITEHEGPTTPARGGSYVLGQVTVLDLTKQSLRELPVIANVPFGWLPADPDDVERAMLGEPRFLSDREIAVALPTGAEQRFFLGEA